MERGSMFVVFVLIGLFVVSCGGPSFTGILIQNETAGGSMVLHSSRHVYIHSKHGFPEGARIECSCVNKIEKIELSFHMGPSVIHPAFNTGEGWVGKVACDRFKVSIKNKLSEEFWGSVFDLSELDAEGPVIIDVGVFKPKKEMIEGVYKSMPSIWYTAGVYSVLDGSGGIDICGVVLHENPPKYRDTNPNMTVTLCNMTGLMIFGGSEGVDFISTLAPFEDYNVDKRTIHCDYYRGNTVQVIEPESRKDIDLSRGCVRVSSGYLYVVYSFENLYSSYCMNDEMGEFSNECQNEINAMPNMFSASDVSSVFVAKIPLVQ